MGDLWTTRKVPRKNKLDLMHKVATGTLNWCVGAWKIHQKAMRHVKGNFDAFAKKTSTTAQIATRNRQRVRQTECQITGNNQTKIETGNSGQSHTDETV